PRREASGGHVGGAMATTMVDDIPLWWIRQAAEARCESHPARPGHKTDRRPVQRRYALAGVLLLGAASQPSRSSRSRAAGGVRPAVLRLFHRNGPRRRSRTPSVTRRRDMTSLTELLGSRRASILELWTQRIRWELAPPELSRGELWDHLP